MDPAVRAHTHTHTQGSTQLPAQDLSMSQDLLSHSNGHDSPGTPQTGCPCPSLCSRSSSWGASSTGDRTGWAEGLEVGWSEPALSEKRGVCMVSLGKEQKVPRTGVDYTPMRIGEEKAARDQGLVELAGDLGWGAFSPQVPLTRAPSCAVESAPKQADSSRNTVSLPFIFPWNMG